MATPSEDVLKLRTHVGRDLLSSAAAFKSDAAVVWEYVVNSIQYVDAGVTPKVLISVNPKDHRVEVHDNGRGMDEADLHNFFTLHGENLDRKRGRPGRGKFGTGKSAAFGIAKTLRIVTRRNGVANEVILKRADVDNSTGDEIPVTWIVKNQPTQESNGTSVYIEDVFIDDLKRNRIQEYIERHLASFRGVSPSVAVNEHICEPRVPDVVETLEFLPSAEQELVIGPVKLFVRVSPAPLPSDMTGVAITAGLGNLVALEDCGISAKEYGSYLFGDIDVPTLETYDTPMEAYDDSRSLKLNPSHPVVRSLIPFIASCLERVRRDLVQKHRDAQKSEQARRLAQTADKIAEVLNKDFLSQKDRLSEIRTATASSSATNARFGQSRSAANEMTDWQAGTDEPGEIEKSTPPEERGTSTGRDEPNIRPSGSPNPSGPDSVSPSGGKGTKPGARGGFTVAYENHGKDNERSKFEINNLRIVINLDHPAVVAALEIGGVEDPTFKRLSYEIAFTEYALGLTAVMVNQDDGYTSADALYDIRDSLRRVTAAAASLYRS